MNSIEPRIPPLPEGEWSEEQRELLSKSGAPRPLNIFTTLVRYPGLFRSFMTFGAHVLAKNTLPPRLRELLILRVGHLCNSAYEFQQHTRIAKMVGVTEEEIERVRRGADMPGWSDVERSLLRAAEELHRDYRVGDATWKELASRHDEKQLMDILFTVGQYTLVSMVLNTLGVPLEKE